MSQPFRRQIGERRARRGVGAVIAVVTFSTAVFIFVAMAHELVMNRQALELEAWRRQADCLARAGVEMAAARLASDPAYPGETWNLSAAALQGEHAATIVVEVVPGEDGTRSVRATADYPDHPIHRVRRTKAVTIALPEAETTNETTTETTNEPSAEPYEALAEPTAATPRDETY